MQKSDEFDKDYKAAMEAEGSRPIKGSPSGITVPENSESVKTSAESITGASREKVDKRDESDRQSFKNKR